MSETSQTPRPIVKDRLPHVEKQLKEVRTLADEALAAANATELYRLLLKSQEDYVDLLMGFNGLVSVYAGNKEREPKEEDAPAIAAMRDVAMGAIDLAKSLIVTAHQGEV